MPARVFVARYLRVSRADQNPQLQADESERLIKARGWELTDTFLDHGISGTKDQRPELTRMMASARRGDFKILVVWRSDRLFRSLKHMVAMIEELRALGIDFVSVSEPFDSTTPQGRLLFHLVSAFAEFERGVLVERTKAGLDAARRRGARIGALEFMSTLNGQSSCERRARAYERPLVCLGLELRLFTAPSKATAANEGLPRALYP
jgi:DNA invertase Pin-like site-specific DNA recombinase